ncbi:titin-like isoform X2 [Lytechinus variegatus]|uniref:titin-like isoform X2 n=1 Tax=Lytechinus variegatus TaxID=7654 RepID=UPI001BB18B6F|nr:titin-like isoform X2 [Lytechinus variegatus]
MSVGNKPSYKGPKIEVRQQSRSIEEGKRVNLFCRLTEEPETVHWILDDEDLKSGGRFKVWNDKCDCYCQILVTKEDDAGLYVFKARNKRGECCTTFSLHVIPAVKPLSDVDVKELLWQNTQQNEELVKPIVSK